MSTLLMTGSSSTRLAREALSRARQILSPGHTEEPPCAVCRRIREETHPDFFIAAREGTQIKVERVREAITFAAGYPYEAPARVAWIRDAEDLRREGGNALLKSLEEPGKKMTWILSTTAPEALAPTILSRCTRLDLPAPTSGEIERLFERRGLTPDEAREAAAFGLDPEEEDLPDLSPLRQQRQRTLAALASGQISAAFAIAAEYEKEESWPSLLAGLLRDAAVTQACGRAAALRHQAVAGLIGKVAQSYTTEAVREAALAAERLARPGDQRTATRLARESVLLKLMGRREGIGERP